VGSGGSVTLTTSLSGAVLFTVTTAQLNAATSLNFVYANASSITEVIVNVVGSGSLTLTNFQIFTGGVNSAFYTYNLCSATTLTITSFGLLGNLLAPFTDITINNGNINGNVVGLSLRGTGSGEVNLPTCP